jgi:hypothetical protein
MGALTCLTCPKGRGLRNKTLLAQDNSLNTGKNSYEAAGGCCEVGQYIAYHLTECSNCSAGIKLIFNFS